MVTFGTIRTKGSKTIKSVFNEIYRWHEEHKNIRDSQIILTKCDVRMMYETVE